MKNRHTCIAILWMSVTLFGCGEKGHEIYVSPDGNDGANGKLSTPVASLQRAAELVRNNVFVCGDDIPPIRYNRTKEEDIQKIDNTILTQSSETDQKRLEEIVKERAADTGPLEKAGRGFKIITYNVWNGYLDREHPRFPCYPSGQKRKEEIYQWIKTQNPDVVVFQELIDYSADQLQEESGFWGHHYAVTLRDKGMAIGLSSKYPIEVKEILTEGMHHGLIYCSISGVDIIGTHLWPRFDDGIVDEIKIVGKRVNESLAHGNPVIVLGDFNAFSPQDDPYIDSTAITIYKKWNWKLENGRPSYRVIQELLGLGMKDVCIEFEKNSVARKLRYDFIFASSGLAEKCTDATHYQDEEFLKLSDHFPVTASFKTNK